jgi:hypothetical protein
MTYASDIPMSLATAAHSGTSFVPEKRAEQHRTEYDETLTEDYETFRKHAVQGGTLELLDEEFSSYRAGYRSHYTAWLSAKSRCISVMITGPSNFPSRRNAKRNDTEHKRCEDLIEFRKRAMAAVIRNLRPDLRPIMSGDEDATDRLSEKIAKAEEEQNKMRAANAAIRKHKKAGAETQIRALVDLGFAAVIAEELLKPDFAGRIGFADYQLTNNNANIRRMKERLAHVAEQKTTQNNEVEGELARVEDCPAENRVRLFFPGKPDEATRTALKSGGFRWTPTLGCWQAYRNQWNLDKARAFAGVKVAA